MKIAMFHELPPGGARRAVNELARELKKKHTVDLYYVDSTKNVSETVFFTHSYFFQFKPKVWKGKNWKIRLYKDTIELLKLYFLHKKISHKIKKHKYDILFIHSSKFTEAPFLLRFPNENKVFYCHDPHYRMLYEPVLKIANNLDTFRKTYEKINRSIRKIIDKTNLTHADLILSNSEYTKQGVKKTYGLESKVCYLGVDHKVFKPIETKKDIDLFYIGSSEPVDGYPLLQEIVKKIPKQITTRCILVEDEWIDSDKELQTLYCRSKVVLSLSVNEPLGLVPLEAMACGTPVIATNEAGHKETVKDGLTGYLVAKNSTLIAKQLLRLIRSESKRIKMGHNARQQIVEKWTWQLAAKRIEAIFLKEIQT